MSSGKAYPMPTYIPPLSVFNPLFFPQSFDTTTTSGGGGGFTNIFPNGLTSGNVITMDGGTGGGGGTGAERTITGLSQIEWTDFTSTNPTTITGYMKLNSGILEIGSNTASSGINVNLLGSSILANGVAIGTGTGNVSTTANNTFLAPATTQTFNNQNIVISNGGTIQIGGTAGGNPTPSYIYFPTTFPTGSTGNNGLAYFWNNTDGGGEVSMICYAQGAGGGTTPAGGLQIYSVNSSSNPPQLLASFLYGGSSISTNPTIPTSTTIGTLTASQTATTYLLNTTYAPLASPALTGTPTSTTAIAGTNNTQIATTAFVATSFAPLASPALTGNPTAPTQSFPNNTSRIATTAFVSNNFAPLASPALTGTPTSTTAIAGTNTTQIATTAFVQSAIPSLTTYAPLANPVFTGVPEAPTATAGTNTTQLATTAFVQNAISGGSFITANWTAQLNGVNTEWKGWIPSSITATTFSFYFYTNTPANTENRAEGEQITPDNSQLCGYGVAYRQNYQINGTLSYGYVFTILSYIGLSIASPNLTIYSVGYYPPNPTAGCSYCYLKNANDGGYFYITPDNGLTLLISQAS